MQALKWIHVKLFMKGNAGYHYVDLKLEKAKSLVQN